MQADRGPPITADELSHLWGIQCPVPGRQGRTGNRHGTAAIQGHDATQRRLSDHPEAHQHLAQRVLRGPDGGTGIEHARTASGGGAEALQLISGCGQRCRIDTGRHGRIGAGRGEGPSTGAQQGAQFIRPQAGVDRQHQSGDSGDLRRREACANRSCRSAIGIARPQRAGGAQVRGRQNRIQARLGSSVDTVPPRGTDHHVRPQAGEAIFGADLPEPTDGNHPRAIGGQIDSPAIVACRGNHGNPGQPQLSHGALVERTRSVRIAARAGAAQAHIDQPRRVRIDWHPGN